MVKNQNCVIWIEFHCIHKKQMIFTEILKKMFETRFDNSKYELDRPIPKGKNLKK